MVRSSNKHNDYLLSNRSVTERTILGIDPGLNHTGWGVISCKCNILSHLASGVIQPNNSLPLAERLRDIYIALNEVIHTFQPKEIAIEKTFVNTNAQSSLLLGHARGVAMLTGAMCGLSVYEYSANLIKKSITGQGKANKAQVMAMIRFLLPKVELYSEDQADALAIAITHNNHFIPTH